jgi:hypothetical protein
MLNHGRRTIIPIDSPSPLSTGSVQQIVSDWITNRQELKIRDSDQRVIGMLVIPDTNLKLDSHPSVPVALRRCKKIGSGTGRTIHDEFHPEVTAHPADSEENEIRRQRRVEVHVLYPVVPQTPVDFVHNGKELRNIGFTTGTTHRHCRSRQNQLCNLLNTNSVSTDAVNVETLVRRKFADVVAQTPCNIAEDNGRAGVRHPNSVRVNLRQHDNGSARTDPGNSLNHAGRQDNRRARNLELRLRINICWRPDNWLGHPIVGTLKTRRNGNLMVLSR